MTPQLKESKNRRAPLVAALRMEQWTKNLLVAAPAVAGQCILVPGVAWHIAALFVSFCLVASAVYLLNDALDLDADRAHPDKRHRPLASGQLQIGTARRAAVLLLAAGFGLAGIFLPAALPSMGVYAALGLLYSGFLKRVALLDAFVLACLYLLRLVAGHTVHSIAYSPWLFSFLLFLFLSLAMSKRAAELSMTGGDGAIIGRGYKAADRGLVTTFGVGCAIASVVLLSIYTQSPHVRALYAQPAYLLMTTPLILIWLGRIWLLAGRGELKDDPVEFALRDGLFYLVLLLGSICFLLARTGWLPLNMID